MRKFYSKIRLAALFLVCQVLSFAPALTSTASAISDAQSEAIVTHCSSIIDDLKSVQKSDSHARVYLGGYYETIISKFITPLNIRLVENSLSTAELVENQNNFISTKATFVDNFVTYQRELESLISIDCATQPEDFYTQLGKVRDLRATVAKDVKTLRDNLTFHIDTITVIEGKL